MKLELKTENNKFSKSLSDFFRIIFFLTLIVIFCDLSLKLGIISRHYQIEYNCILLSTETSQSNFKELSKLSKLKNKRKIWEFCREFID
jgi:cysteinyl-tRNA synthetase